MSNHWISREKKDWFVAALVLGAVLLLGAWFWRSNEPAMPRADAPDAATANGARAVNQRATPGVATAGADNTSAAAEKAAATAGSAPATSPAAEPDGDRKTRRRAGVPGNGGAPELTYVPASEPAPHNMESDGFMLAAGATNPDVVALAGTVRDYRSALGENPVGNNAEITRALLGDNPRHAQFLPPDALRNDAGQLLDRWGHPYYFHAISRTEMEVHSAGPDGVMWSADDQVSR